MAGVLAKFDEDVSYWDASPQSKTIGAFKKLYSGDKSKGKQASSKIMWAVAMLLEPEDNRLALHPEEDRRKIIEEDYLNKKNFKWDKSIVKEYEASILTHAKRALIIQRRKTDERTKFLATVPYTLANAKELDSLLANTEKFLTILQKLEDVVNTENSIGNKKGGRAESLSEQKII